MPPRRSLPDLVLITVFKMLKPNEQMVAIEMSLRCAVLVRAANRTVKTLVITNRNVENPSDLENIKDQINIYSLASKPAMQLLMDSPSEPSFPTYPMTTHLSKWDCLKIDSKGQIDIATIEKITTIFSAVTDLKFLTVLQKDDKHLVALLQHLLQQSAVTDLKFITYSSIHFKTLVALLQHPTWQRQLTNLIVGVSWCVDGPVACQLFTAINGLPALQYLAFDFFSTERDLPDLSIFGQLKAVAIKAIYLYAWIWRSLNRHAADNADLQVHLLTGDTKTPFNLSQPLHSRIVRLEGGENFLYYPSALRLCDQFRSLTSLSIRKCYQGSREVGPLFTALSQLHQLVHLYWMVDFEKDEVLSARPLTPLKSLRALTLYLIITAHSQVQWLNLPVTMPNLQSIFMETFICGNCNVFSDWNDSCNSPSGLSCLASSICTLHFGVPPNRLILNISDNERISAEKQLLLEG